MVSISSVAFADKFINIATENDEVVKITVDDEEKAAVESSFSQKVAVRVAEMTENYIGDFPFTLRCQSEFECRIYSVLNQLPKDRVINLKEIIQELDLKKGSVAVGKVLHNCPYQFIFPIHNIKTNNRYIEVFNGNSKLSAFMQDNLNSNVV